MVDHSILRPETTVDETVKQSVAVAGLGVFSVCVKPVHVRAVAEALEGVSTLVTTVIGFPHGNAPMVVKMAEGEQAIVDGAVELDIVADYSTFFEGPEATREEADRIEEFAVRMKELNPRVLVKVILETGYFTEEQIRVIAGAFADKTHVDFLKTSTGFAPVGGATVEAVRALYEGSNGKNVKASGGVTSATDAQVFVDAGATRLGCGKTALVAESFES